MQSFLKEKGNLLRKIGGGFCLISLILVLLTSCQKRQRRADVAIGQGILLLNNGTEPKTLDPHLATGVPENNVISALIEGLIAYHPSDDNEAEPGVAERWESSEDYRVWTFYLRKNARWSQGAPVTAHDFVFSYRRILSPTLGAEYADMLYVMKNAEAYHRGDSKNFDEVGVKALDEHTLQITLVGPTPYFLSMLKHYSWFPVDPATIEKFGKSDDRLSPWTRPENYTGNGPFQLKEWKTNQIIKVVKNPHYWDAENVQLNEIHFFAVENPNTDDRSFFAGQSHNVYQVPIDKIAFHRKNHPDLIHFDPYLGTYFYRFNVTRKPFDDVRVRQALSLAVDRKRIVKQITRGGQRPAYSYTPDGMAGYTPPQILAHDLEQARLLLAEAGYPEGQGFPVVDILINDSENHRKIAEAIQEMWRKHLHIQTSISKQEWKVYLDAQSSLEYDISRSGWIGDYMDPITFLTMYTTGNGNNDTGWSNQRYDSLIYQAQQVNDRKKRFQILEEAEKLLLTEAPIIPIYWYTRIYLLDPRVKNWNPKLLDNHPYKYVYLED